MASASSWKGKMFSSSPLRTEGHMRIVSRAEEPLVLASRTILLRSRPSVVGMRLCSSMLSCVRALM